MRRIALAMVLGLATSGCVSVPDAGGTGPAVPPPEGPARFPWGIADCAFVILSIPVDAERLESRLPEGFELRAGDVGRITAGSQAAIDLDAYECRSGIGLNGTLEGVQYGSYYTAVEPPAALREESYDAYFVKWDFLVPDVARRQTFAGGGLPAHDGSARVALGPAGLVSASMEFRSGGGFRLEGAVGPLEPQTSPLPFMEFTPLEGKVDLARWHARLHDARIGSGAGEVELLPGSWVAELVGASRVPATFIAGGWNLDEADVSFPVPWPPT